MLNSRSRWIPPIPSNFLRSICDDNKVSFLSAWVVTGLWMGSDKHWIAQTCGSCHFKRKEVKCSDAGECIKFLLRQLPTRYSVCQGCVPPNRICTAKPYIFFIRTVSKAWPGVLVLDILYQSGGPTRLSVIKRRPHVRMSSIDPMVLIYT